MIALRNGQWRGSPAPPLGHDPQGKVLGILGMGGIGRNLMKKAAAFGMTTQYYNRTQLSEELSGGAKYVSFEELLKTSDVLSLNLPLNVKSPSPSPTRKRKAWGLVADIDGDRKIPATSSPRANSSS